MSTKLYFKLLPVQVMIVAMASINSIVDGAVAGRFIDARTVGVIGLFSAMVFVLNGISSVFLGGSAVLSGRYIGSGDLESTRGIFSLNITLATAIGFFITFILLLCPRTVAMVCGADAELTDILVRYIIGYAPGVIPCLLANQLASFLELERQSKRNYIGIGAMILFNITFNIIFVVVFKLSILGLAISTSLCNWIYFIILATYYLGDRPQLKYSFKKVLWEDTWPLVKLGSPGAFLVFCLALREMALNRVVLTYVGDDGLSAKSALGLIGGLFIALCLGSGAVIRMLASVHVGEEDKDSIKELMKLAFTKVLIMSVIIAVIVIAISGLVVQIFFPDTSSNVYKLAYQYFILYGASIPLIMVVQIFTNYLQALGKSVCVNVFSFVDGFASVVVPAALLAPVIGAMGIWLATPIGITITACVYPIYAIIYWRRIPRNVDEWLLLGKDFGVADEERLILNIDNINDVTSTSEKTQEFCKERGFDKKKALYTALCLEEMTRNVVEHGFTGDKEKHYLEARVVHKADKVILRIKDDCPAFDPVEMSQNLNSEDPTGNIGIRMVMKLADETTYQNMLGLNVLTIGMKP